MTVQGINTNKLIISRNIREGGDFAGRSGTGKRKVKESGVGMLGDGGALNGGVEYL